jgi:uncharacterized membrane-anchored protein YhcB (DUF1043 family)
MDQNVLLTIVEFIASLVIEGIILGLVFQLITNRSDDKMQQNLQIELNNIEKQNKFEYEQLKEEIYHAKIDVVSQLKENNSKNP